MQKIQQQNDLYIFSFNFISFNYYVSLVQQ